MTQPDSVTCPVDGCDYTGFHDSVCAHYAGKKDDAHSGGYEIAKMKIADGDSGGDSGESVDIEVTEANFPEGDGNTDENTGGRESDESDDLDSGLSCPRCDESDELYEASAVKRDVPDAELTGEYGDLLDDSDAVCGVCGGVFDIE